jgi:RimJ/RimL family protein N-acetyltransferase
MSAPERIETARLVLRRDWTEANRAALARMCADPQVMRYFPSVWDRERTDEAVDRFNAHFASHGYSIWVVEERASGAFVGMVGLIDTRPGKPFPQPQTEFAWRVDAPYWGRGYTGEAAIAAGNDALARAGIAELMAYTTVGNAPSRRVMEKVGLSYCPEEDFGHLDLPPESPLRPHVIYRIAAADWRARHGGRS